jgi:ribonuclease-3
MYLDSDLETVRRFVLEEAAPNIENLRLEPEDVNPKGRLQELLQAISPKSPSYSVVSQAGPEHQKLFVSRVSWEGRELGRGEGFSKKEAESSAAIAALQAKLWSDPATS